MTDARAYWKRQLEGARCARAGGRPSPTARASHRGGVAVRLLPPRCWIGSRLWRVMSGPRSSLVLFAGFATMATRYTGADDLVVGVPSAAGPAPMRRRWSASSSTRCPCGSISPATRLRRAHRAGPPHRARGARRTRGFRSIRSSMRPELRGVRTGPPLVQVMFGYDSAGEASRDLGGLTVDPHPAYSGTREVRSERRGASDGDRTRADRGIQTDLFDADRIGAGAGDVEVLLGGRSRIRSMACCPAAHDRGHERQRVLVDENAPHPL